jgi:preprotein translocase subunit SecY
MVDAFSLPDLRSKILFTLAMLVAFRFIAHIPLPGVDFMALRDLFAKSQLLGMLDLFSGGAMRNFSVAAMGVYPYIMASIVMQLMVPVIPRLQALAKEGEAGRDKINQYTHWLTIPLAFGQGYGQLVLLQREGIISGIGFSGANLLPTIAMLATLTGGTMLLVWIGELINQHGIGNGISIIIFGGIVAGLWAMVGQGIIAWTNPIGVVTFVLLTLATIVLIVIFTEAHRRIPVQYARSAFRGGKMYRHGGASHIPIRVNSAGMIPLIFAISLMMFPGTVASYFPNNGFAQIITRVFDSTGTYYWGLPYWGLYFALVIAFAFFYTMVIWQQQNLAENLQKQGGFIPGVRPGRSTAEYLDKVITRITWGGALFLALIAVMPFLARTITNVQALTISSFGLLIIVGVALDTMKQLEAQLLMRRYEGFIK